MKKYLLGMLILIALVIGGTVSFLTLTNQNTRKYQQKTPESSIKPYDGVGQYTGGPRDDSGVAGIGNFTYQDYYPQVQGDEENIGIDDWSIVTKNGQEFFQLKLTFYSNNPEDIDLTKFIKTQILLQQFSNDETGNAQKMTIDTDNLSNLTLPAEGKKAVTISAGIYPNQNKTKFLFAAVDRDGTVRGSKILELKNNKKIDN